MGSPLREPNPPFSFNNIGNSDASPLLPSDAVVDSADAGQSTNLQHYDSYWRALLGDARNQKAPYIQESASSWNVGLSGQSDHAFSIYSVAGDVEATKSPPSPSPSQNFIYSSAVIPPTP